MIRETTRELTSPATTQRDTTPPQGQRARFFPRLIATALLLTLGAGVVPATMLTLKTGEVMAKESSVHVVASPRIRANMIAMNTRRDKPAGVVGNNVSVFVGDTITFVPTRELCGKIKGSMVAIPCASAEFCSLLKNILS